MNDHTTDNEDAVHNRAEARRRRNARAYARRNALAKAQGYRSYAEKRQVQQELLVLEAMENESTETVIEPGADGAGLGGRGWVDGVEVTPADVVPDVDPQRAFAQAAALAYGVGGGSAMSFDRW